MTTHAERMAAIPLEELVKDKQDSEQDIAMCRMALSHNIMTFGNWESIRERLENNQRIIVVIDAELERRLEAAGELEGEASNG